MSNIITKFKTNFIDVLKVGNVVENPKLWKRLQQTINYISGITPFLILFFPSLKDYLTVDNITTISGFIAASNIYFTASTSSKIGMI